MTLTDTIDELARRTASLEAELESLRRSEACYRELFENAADLIHVLGNDGRILHANRLWRETLGYTAEEARTLRIFDLVDPSCTPKCQSIFSSLMKGERLPPTETIFIAANGRRIFVEGRCTPKFANGVAVELMGIFRDISERQRVEAERESQMAELHEALATAKSLEGFLPICAACKKIRDQEGAWRQMEEYIHRHTKAQCSHGVCPECAQALYPRFADRRQPEGGGATTPPVPERGPRSTS